MNFLNLFFKTCQEGLQTKMRGTGFTFERVDSLYYHLQKTSLNRGGSYIDSPKWLKNKEVTINPKNDDDDCFKYALTVALNHEEIRRNPQRISKIKPFINTYNWKDIKFPSILMTGKNLNKIIRQLLLIYFLCHTILRK